MKNKVPMINIIIIALFNYVFLGTEYMYDNMMLYVINSNGVVNAQNYILGVSVAGFLMYPLLKRVYRKNNNMLLLHIFKVCVVITGIICIAVMGTHSSYGLNIHKRLCILCDNGNCRKCCALFTCS